MILNSFRPVSFSVKDMTLEAHVVLSTLTDPNLESPSQPAPGYFILTLIFTCTYCMFTADFVFS